PSPPQPNIAQLGSEQSTRPLQSLSSPSKQLVSIGCVGTHIMQNGKTWQPMNAQSMAPSQSLSLPSLHDIGSSSGPVGTHVQPGAPEQAGSPQSSRPLQS